MDLMDVRGKYQIPEGEANYFIDEVNLYFRGVEYTKNQKNHSGIEDFCALARHFSKKVFFSLQRTPQFGNDYDQAKKRLNIRNYKLFLQKRDFENYDTKFFGALLPILNEKRTKKIIPPGQVPVPNTLKDVIKQEFFTVQEKPKQNS
ncbi:3955_t:CDS:2 [Ambispora leptoticha]|uniref:3955_t:CDS:1 n=1 Tax=Ambispora leptoticha TaxID=144679 RepID=A0A9N8V4W4_9GLOM|nr:3955_t:CDS:2 [Ambispora leptoticha]